MVTEGQRSTMSGLKLPNHTKNNFASLPKSLAFMYSLEKIFAKF